VRLRAYRLFLVTVCDAHLVLSEDGGTLGAQVPDPPQDLHQVSVGEARVALPVVHADHEPCPHQARALPRVDADLGHAAVHGDAKQRTELAAGARWG
jgi:hypothetical protein